MPKLTVQDKIVEAVTALAEPGGASRQAITKWVHEHYGEEKPALLKRAFITGVAKGKLVKSGQRFALVGVEIAPRAEESVAKTVLKEGDATPGAEAAEVGDTVTMSYVGKLEDGTVFDRASKFTFTLGGGEVIKGWDQGIQGMRLGEKARLVVPSKLGYGKRGSPPEIPPDATLVFDVCLLSRH